MFDFVCLSIIVHKDECIYDKEKLNWYNICRIVWFLYNEWEKAENSRKGIYWLNLIKTASHDVIIVA